LSTTTNIYQQQHEQINYYQQQQQSQMNYFQPQQSFYHTSLFQQVPRVHQQQQQQLNNCQQVPSFQTLPNSTSTPKVSITKRGRPLGS
jgi:hypothetical protein